jgi:perosamine synthetase
VFEPQIGEEEIQAVVAALKRGEISGSFGESIPQFEQAFADYCGVKYGVAVTSGTTALHLAIAAAGIGVGDEVLVSASTNIATALAVYHNGAVPIAVDSEKLTWNLNLDLIESLITPKTRAIIPVHLFGHPVDMERLSVIAKKHNLIVIEDCAESHGATFNGRMTGGFGDMGCFSFYANKIITTGEGGMVITDNKELASKLRSLRNLAFTKPRFWHKFAGYNFRMTGYQAAMGLAQLSKIDRFIFHKRRVAQTYNRMLAKVHGLQLPPELPGAFNVYWMYALVVNPEFGITRDQLQEYLQEKEIETRTFFCPMNRQPCFESQEGYRAILCPVAEELWEAGLYLPSACNLTETQIAMICQMVSDARQVNCR